MKRIVTLTFISLCFLTFDNLFSQQPTPVYTKSLPKTLPNVDAGSVKSSTSAVKPGSSPEAYGVMGNCPGFSVPCGATITGLSSEGAGNSVSAWNCTNLNLDGDEIFFSVDFTHNGPGEIAITLDNVVDLGLYVEVIFMGTSCNPGNCSGLSQFEVLPGTFLTGTHTSEFSVPGPARYYFAIESQGNGVSSFDLTVGCQRTGIQADSGSADGGAVCDSNDTDLDGLSTTWDGSPEPDYYDAGSGGTVEVCHNIWLQNSGYEWLDSVGVTLGSCWMNPRNFTPNGPNTGNYAQGDFLCGQPCGNSGCWNATVSGNTLSWTYTHPAVGFLLGIGPLVCDIPEWGDGNLLGDNYECARYQFCYTADIDPNCTDLYGFQDHLVAEDDGIGGTGSTTPSQEFFGSNTLNVFPLPVQFIEFSGKAEGNLVTLNWTTRQERDNDRFWIEHSPDGIHFSAVGSVEGAGNSQQIQHYEYRFRETLAGKIYYRIRQTDQNGQFSFSETLELRIQTQRSLILEAVYPQPAQDLLSIHYFSNNPGMVTVRINNLKGKVLHQEVFPAQAGFNDAHLAIPDLQEGIYFLTVEMEGNIVHGKFIKHK